ncbi:MAG: URC4/urg3 family protein [Rubrivivax sp.]|nr:URC4/urg3 family protein [Rubrivivax sp.]
MSLSTASTPNPAAQGMPSLHPLHGLHDAATIRLRCAAILRSVDSGVSPSFTVDRSKLDAAAERVAALTLRRFPDLHIPYHSRWRHFEAGGVDRKAQLDAAMAGRSAAEQARARFDLTVVSVLLDAGAGPTWRYTERQALDSAALPQAAPDDLLAALDRSASATRPTLAAATDAASAAPAAAPGDAAGDDASTGGNVGGGPGGGPDGGLGWNAGGAADNAADGGIYTRSEGLAVASFRAFMAGAFSSRTGEPWRADAAALRHVDAAALRAMFQGSNNNPIVGLEGRAALLSRLGSALQAEALRSGHEARPSLIFERLTANGARRQVSASDLLAEVLRCLAPIWPSGSKVQGLPAGDVWPHRWAGAAVGGGGGATTDNSGGTGGTGGSNIISNSGGHSNRTSEGWVPFHKLSQWMSYSLLEPLQWAGVQVTGLDALTGLPEYRNGGLLIDTGVIVPRDPRLLGRTWKPQDEFIIEWRALTVALLDELADRVRARLGKTAAELPLACILEGGTWAAGREIAKELRPDGAPPVRIDSDGTIF